MSNSTQESLFGLKIKLTATCFLNGVYNSQYGVTYLVSRPTKTDPGSCPIDEGCRVNHGRQR